MMVRLGDVFELQITGEWGNECAENEIGTKVLRTTNFTSEGTINYNNIVVRRIKENKVQKKKLHYGDIILEKSGGTEKTPVGRVVFCDESIENDTYLCNNFTQAMRINQLMAIPKYVFYFMWNLHYSGKTDLLQNKTTGIRNLQVKLYLNENFYLPSLDEQRKIAAVLDKISDLISKRRLQLDKLDELVKARFVEMFGDPVDNDHEWQMQPLDSVCKTIVDCPHSTPSYTDEDTGYMCIRTSIVKKNRILWDEIEYIPEHEYYQRIQRKRPEKGDVVYTREGAILGIAAMIDRECNIALGQRSMLLSPDTRKCLPQFLSMAMNFESFLRKALDGISGSASPHINVRDIKAFAIILPPIEMQGQFAAFVEQTNKLKWAAQNNLNKLEMLKKALMQEYFGRRDDNERNNLLPAPVFRSEKL